MSSGVSVRGMTTCPKCASIWGGLNTAHCSGCHLTYTGITAFDKHRDGYHIKGRGRFCKSPQAAGLVDAHRAYPCWGLPSDDRLWTGPE